MRFDTWKDRFTYLFAEAQLLVGAIIVVVGVLLAWFNPSIPAIPQWAISFMAALFILGPPLFLAGLRFADWLRVRNHVEVFHVNAVEDRTEKWLVPPETWREKTVEGADPWPVNGGGAWAVREFDWQPGIDELVVEGVWLSELSDDKLLTAKRHLDEVHGSLLKKYLELSSIRDRMDRIAVEMQEGQINEAAEARERGQLLDPESVAKTYEDAKNSAEDLGTDDLPTIEETVDLDDPSPDLDQEPADTNGSEP